MIRNQKGSVMSVAIIMIAVLSFSLTSLTAYTFRTAENTNRLVESESEESEGKRLVNEAVAQMKAAVETKKEEDGMTWFEDFTNTNSVKYTDFRDDADNGILAIENALGVDISLAPGRHDSAFTSEDVHQIVFSISYAQNDDREVIKYLYFTDFGAQYEEFDAFEYAMGTNGSVALNGGNYEESTKIYGDRVYSAYSTAYKNAAGDYEVLEAGSFNEPAGYVGPESARFVSPNQYKCPSEVTTCLGTDSGNLTLQESLYDYYDYSETFNNFRDLFMDFEYDSWYFNTLASILGETEDSIDATNYEEDAWYAGLATENTTITQTSDLSLTETTVMDGNATIDLNGNSLVLNDNVLIVRGNLTIESVDEIPRPGKIYVLGDVIIENDQDLHMTSNIYAYGKITVNFDQGFGFMSPLDDDFGMALFAKDNILFERNITVDPVSLFALTEGSIKFESAKYPMNFRGSLYAQAKGDGLSDVFIERVNGLDPFKGILVNSFSGTYDPDSDEFVADGGDNVEPFDSGGDYEEGALVVSDGIVYERTGHQPGKANPSLNAKKFWDDMGPFEGDEDGDHSFEFGGLTEDGGGETASVEEGPVLLNNEPTTPTSNIQTMNYTGDIQPMATEGSLTDTFYGLPTFKQLVIAPESLDDIITETSTFVFESNEN